MEPIRVLVVDDSPFMRKSLQKMLEGASDIQVCGMARDGIEALEKIAELKPDLVTLDIEMPRMDGLTALKKIMAENPVPVLMVSSLTQEGAKATIEALSLGALDFIPKESGYASMSIMKIAEELHEKIRKLARSNVVARRIRPTTSRPGDGAGLPLRTPILPPPSRPLTPLGQKSAPKAAGGGLPMGLAAELIVLGSSTGGPKALQELLPAIPKTLPVPWLIVQHMPATFTKPFAERLNGLCELTVKEAEMGEVLKPATVYIAPGGVHMVFRTRGPQSVVELTQEPVSHIHRPSVDVLFQSVADHFHRPLLALILTGMGHDGAAGMEQLKKKLQSGTIAEAEETCVVYGMPKAAAERGCVDLVAPLQDIAGHIRKHFRI